jgi:excinuclease ABC subunit A
VIDIDQSPIGRTPRSNPATYTGVFDDIRDCSRDERSEGARLQERAASASTSRAAAAKPAAATASSRSRCTFLPDVYVPCEVCKGKRYNRETLEVKYKGKSIADVLEMTIEDAWSSSKNIPRFTASCRRCWTSVSAI